MRRIKIRECDWCGRDIQTTGKYADPFVINGERKIFCKVHYKGHEPDIDCMRDYLDYKRRMENDKISKQTKLKKEKEEEKQKEKEKKIESIPRVLAKTEAFLKEHKQRQVEAKLYKRLHEWNTTKTS